MVQEKSLLDAMGKASDSINALVRFMLALKHFLEVHKLGVAEFELIGDPEIYSGRGYHFAGFRLASTAESEDIIYLHFYTNGTADGENFSKEGPDLGIDCSWNDALREILKTLGVLQHSALSREKVEKAVVAFE